MSYIPIKIIDKTGFIGLFAMCPKIGATAGRFNPPWCGPRQADNDR